MQRARRILADKQAAWDNAMARVDQEKEETMAKRIHLLIDDECPCGFEWDGESENCIEEYEEVTCKKCIANAPVHYLLADEETACGLDSTQGKMSEDLDNVTCEECIMNAEEEKEDNEEEEVSAPVPVPVVPMKAIFTLAPRTLDKGDSKEVLCPWLYQGTTAQGLNQPIRKVLVPQIQVESQINSYLHPTPYLTFQEQSLEKYIAQGKVTEAPVSASVLADQTTMILNTIAPEKEKAMPKNPIVKVQTTIKPVATITDVVHANMPTPSALDAILAQPIAHIMQQTPVGVPEEFVTRLATPKRPLALPEERSEEALARALTPDVPAYRLAYDPLYVQLAQLVMGLQSKVASLEERLCLAGQVDKVPAPEPEIWGSILDVPAMPAPVAPPLWGSELDAPVKPKSTLQIFAGGHKAPRTAPKAARASNGKTDPAIIKAIQKAWNSGKVSQADLAVKYGMDSKKVWFFCNRAKQLV